MEIDTVEVPRTYIAEAELEQLISQYGHALLKYCHSILLDYHEAQDVVQVTFAKVYSRLASPGADEIHGSWLYKSAYNQCIDILRRKKLYNMFFPAQKEPSYTESYFIKEEVSDILQQLPPKDRALVYSRAVEGLDYKELEGIYGASSAVLRKRYERAKKKLASKIGGGLFGT